MFRIALFDRQSVTYAAVAALVGGIATATLLIQGQLFVAGVVMLFTFVALAPLLLTLHKNGEHTSSTARPTTTYATYATMDEDSDNAPLAEQHIITDKGDMQRAWVVPMDNMGEHQLVLTRDGYKLVDGTGRAVYDV